MCAIIISVTINLYFGPCSNLCMYGDQGKSLSVSLLSHLLILVYTVAATYPEAALSLTLNSGHTAGKCTSYTTKEVRLDERETENEIERYIYS